MADLGEIGLLIRTYGEKQAIKAMEDYTKSIQRNLNEIRRQADTRRRLQQQREREIQKELDSNRRALDGQRKLAMAYKSLKSSVDPASRAQQQYDAAVKTLNRSLEQNVITLEEQQKALAQVRQQMELAGYQVNEFGRVLEGSSRALSRNMRAGLQQAGYQFGDFAVQVQGGTSAMVALGQQGSQLLGLFGYQGAIAGAVLAMSTALINGFMQARGAGQTLDDSMQELRDTFERLGDSYDILNNEKLNEEFGSLTGSIRMLTEQAVELDNALSLKKLSETLDRLRTENIEPGFFQQLSSGVAAGTGAGLGAITYQDHEKAFAAENFAEFGFDIGKEVYDQMTQGIMEQAGKGEISKVVQGIAELMRDALPNTVEGLQGVSTEGLALLDAFRAIAEFTARVEAQADGTAEAERLINERIEENLRLMKQVEDATKRRAENATEILQELQNERREAEALQGLDGRALLVAEQTLERERMIAQLREQGVISGEARERSALADLTATQAVALAEYDRKEAAKQNEEAQTRIERILQRARDAIREAGLEYDKNKASAGEMLVTLQREGAVLAAIAQFGENSSQAAEARAQSEADALETKIRELFATTELNAEQQAILDAALSQLSLNQDNESLIAGQAAEARALADAMRDAAAAMSSLESIGASVEVRLAQTRARIEAISSGADEAAAGFVAGQYTRAQQEMQRAVEAGTPISEAESAYTSATGNLPTLLEAMNQLASSRQSARSGGRGGRGGRGGGRGDTDQLAKLEREISQRKTLLSLRGDERDLMEEIFSIQNSLGTEMENYSQARIEQIARENMALKEQEERLNRLENMAETLANSFTSAFISFVEGAKSAREIAADLLRMLAQMVINFAFKALFSYVLGIPLFAKGGVFSGGNVTPFADGGVVGGPTMFPMSGGRTGLMGEAGPEAIMPLKRGPDGKLGVQSANNKPQKVEIVITAEEGEMFAPRVRQISTTSAVQVSQRAMGEQSKRLEGDFTQLQKRGVS